MKKTLNKKNDDINGYRKRKVTFFSLKWLLVCCLLAYTFSFYSCSFPILHHNNSNELKDRFNKVKLNSNNHYFRPENKNHQLAYHQSYGFFGHGDISDEEWKLRQEIHARIFPNRWDSSLSKRYAHPYFAENATKQYKIQKVSKSNLWYAENFQVEFTCPYAQRLPSNYPKDGPKWVCDPHRLKSSKNCLVYSVGSNGNIVFEKAIKELVPSCEIHTFDPSAYNKRTGSFEKVLKGYSTFHQWGFIDEETKQKETNGRGRRRRRHVYKTLRETMEELGHANRTIDIFKIDCEWCEWTSYLDWIDARPKQILVETHNAPLPNAKNFFYSLHDTGYVIFSKEANYPGGGHSAEYGFLHLHTDFFINRTLYLPTEEVRN